MQARYGVASLLAASDHVTVTDTEKVSSPASTGTDAESIIVALCRIIMG